MVPQLSRRAHFPKDCRFFFLVGAKDVMGEDEVVAEHESGESQQVSLREVAAVVVAGVAKDTFSIRSLVADHTLTALDTVILSAINNSPSVNIPLVCKGDTRGRAGPRARLDMFWNRKNNDVLDYTPSRMFSRAP